MRTRINRLVESRRVFQRLANRYDAWYETPQGRALFEVERACILLALGAEPPHPWLEVGVGTGRFAAALGIDQGIDEAAAPLAWAAQQGVKVRQGMAEQLPYADGQFGALFMIMTLCFLKVPLQALTEAARVLREEGSLLLASVPYDSAWGNAYMRKAQEGHPFYAAATFHATAEVEALAAHAGLSVSGSASCLLESPEAEIATYSAPQKGILPGAGFVVLKLSRSGHPLEGVK